MEQDKKEFVKLFGEYLRLENILQNYDEFHALTQSEKTNLVDGVEEPSGAYNAGVTVPSERVIQDYRSTYNDIRDWLRKQKTSDYKDKTTIDWDDVVFEIDLLKSQEINLDYILGLVFENHKKTKDKPTLINEIRRIIRSSVGNRAKESLIVDFINQTNLDNIPDKASIIEAFFQFAQKEQQREAQALIKAEQLNEEAAKRYISTSLKREYASENGTDLNAILPKMSPLNPKYLTLKQTVFQKISAFIEKFKGIGGSI